MSMASSSKDLSVNGECGSSSLTWNNVGNWRSVIWVYSMIIFKKPLILCSINREIFKAIS